MTAMYGHVNRLDGPDRSEPDAIADEIRSVLRAEGVFDARAVEVENLKPSTRVEGDTEGTWAAMNGQLDVLSGSVVIDWADTDHLSGSVTVYVGSAGIL